jgi:hypothetical protein
MNDRIRDAARRSRALECGGLPPLSDCGSLLPLSSMRPRTPGKSGGKPPQSKAAASCRTPRRRCAPLITNH